MHLRFGHTRRVGDFLRPPDALPAAQPVWRAFPKFSGAFPKSRSSLTYRRRQEPEWIRLSPPRWFSSQPSSFTSFCNAPLGRRSSFLLKIRLMVATCRRIKLDANLASGGFSSQSGCHDAIVYFWNFLTSDAWFLHQGMFLSEDRVYDHVRQRYPFQM